MNTQFTPGPWRIENGPLHHIHPDDRQIIDSNQWPVAHLNGHNRILDAQLIAAAPELFEACRAVLTRQDWPIGTCKIKAQIVAALAKATGGQP